MTPAKVIGHRRILAIADHAPGVLTSPDVPGEIWVHFSSIEMDGYRNLVEGQRVEFDCERYPPGQDGYFYRARRVRPI
jgi:CspA family cold shock protein